MRSDCERAVEDLKQKGSIEMVRTCCPCHTQPFDQISKKSRLLSQRNVTKMGGLWRNNCGFARLAVEYFFSFRNLFFFVKTREKSPKMFVS